MPVIGTAGHVDHGKSTLIVALTGRDPDRLAEEKRRGLTLDLGFSWMTLPGVGEVSFVDMPGHRDYLKNMLAGVGGVDVALLVVAADEGWMTQSAEHLAVLDLLGITEGVVALTKVDRVDEPRVAEVRERVTTELAGTSLSGSSVISVAAPGGQGVRELISALAQAVRRVPPVDAGRPRLWVDRAFNVAGVGTVVTGTLVGGSLSVGDKMSIWPTARESRVRSLQSHEHVLDSVGPARRVAVGLVGIDREAVSRGDMLGLPGQWIATDRAIVEIRGIDESLSIGEKGAFHFHLGSGAWSGRLRTLTSTTAIVTLAKPTCLEVGDRLIIRDVGRARVVGAATVLDPSPVSGRDLRRSISALAPILRQTPNERAQTLLTLRGADRLERLAAHTGGGRASAAIEADGSALSEEKVEDLITAAELLVRDHHAARPLDKGVSKATLASRLKITIGLLDRVLALTDSLIEVGDAIAVVGHSPELSPSDESEWRQARARLASSGLEVPLVKDLGLTAGLVRHLERAGHLVVITGDLVFLPEQAERLTAVLDGFAEPFTVSDFRQAARVSRKYAVPFLEWTDKMDMTRRHGDTRIRIGRVADGDDNRTRQGQ